MSTSDPIVRTLELYQEFYVEVNNVRNTKSMIMVNDYSSDDVVPIAEKFVDLMQYAMDQFDKEPCTTKNIVDIKACTHGEELTLVDLTSISKSVIPMLLMLSTLSKNKNLYISVASKRISPIFKRFAERYAPLIPK